MRRYAITRPRHDTQNSTRRNVIDVRVVCDSEMRQLQKHANKSTTRYQNEKDLCRRNLNENKQDTINHESKPRPTRELHRATDKRRLNQRRRHRHVGERRAADHSIERKHEPEHVLARLERAVQRHVSFTDLRILRKSARRYETNKIALRVRLRASAAGTRRLVRQRVPRSIRGARCCR